MFVSFPCIAEYETKHLSFTFIYKKRRYSVFCVGHLLVFAKKIILILILEKCTIQVIFTRQGVNIFIIGVETARHPLRSASVDEATRLIQ